MKRSKIVLLIFLCVFVLCGGIIAFGISLIHVCVPVIEETYMESTSPDGNYTVVVFRENSGATNAFTIRCELINNASGEKKTFYWERGAGQVEIEWKNNDEVIINDNILNIHTDYYDNR